MKWSSFPKVIDAFKQIEDKQGLQKYENMEDNIVPFELAVTFTQAECFIETFEEVTIRELMRLHKMAVPMSVGEEADVRVMDAMVDGEEWAYETISGINAGASAAFMLMSEFFDGVLGVHYKEVMAERKPPEDFTNKW